MPDQPGRVESRSFAWRFRNGGAVHRVWLWAWGRPLWPWRWLCWLDGKHDRWGNGRRDYCIRCGKDMP